MSFHLERSERVVKFVSAPGGEGLFPVSSVRVEGIRELMMAPVCFGIRPSRGTKQREPQHAGFGVVSVFRFIDQAQPVETVPEIGPTQRWNLELRCLPAVVASSGTLDGAVRNFVRCSRTRDSQGERSFQ